MSVEHMNTHPEEERDATVLPSRVSKTEVPWLSSDQQPRGSLHQDHGSRAHPPALPSCRSESLPPGEPTAVTLQGTRRHPAIGELLSPREHQ